MIYDTGYCTLTPLKYSIESLCQIVFVLKGRNYVIRHFMMLISRFKLRGCGAFYERSGKAYHLRLACNYSTLSGRMRLFFFFLQLMYDFECRYGSLNDSEKLVIQKYVAVVCRFFHKCWSCDAHAGVCAYWNAGLFAVN